MGAADEAGFRWREETITDLLLAEARSTTDTYVYGRAEEAQTGADWLWWWIDSTGQAFGLMVQAKRLKRKSDGYWYFDVSYRSWEQWERLLESASQLGVAAVYSLYFGTQASRAPVSCGLPTHAIDCLNCRRAAVSTISTLAMGPGGINGDGALALEYSVPLECLDDERGSIRPARVLGLEHFQPELRRFLLAEPTGVRRIARRILDPLATLRFHQFSAPVQDLTSTDEDDRVFAELPHDRGDLGRPYLGAVLDGLRTAPPGYVLEALSGAGDWSAQLPPGVGGMVILRV